MIINGRWVEKKACVTVSSLGVMSIYSSNFDWVAVPRLYKYYIYNEHEILLEKKNLITLVDL